MYAKNSKERLKFSERLLKMFCKSSYIEEILGDLAEYRDELMEKPKWKRRVFYWFHVLNFLRPWALKRFTGTQNLNQYGMFKNYLKTSIRSLRKNALFSTINAIGLAISMSIGILLIVMLSELNSFDNFHSNKDNIYRVTSNKVMFGQEMDMAAASHYLGDEIQKQVPGVDNVLIVRNGVSADMNTEAGSVSVEGLYATRTFFELFSFNLLNGNPATVLDGPDKIVLTESTAQKLFRGENAMGKPLELESNGGWQQRTIKGEVVGIVEDPPLNSHIQFEILVSMDTYDQPATGTGWRRDHRTNPGYFQNSQVYMTLNEETKREDVEAAMVSIVEAYNAEQENPVTHLLQPLDTFVTSDKYTNRLGPRFSQYQIYIMLGLTSIVLLSACFNYTNLSLARALRRSKEIGVRKVSGASRVQVFSQFIVESILLSLLALIVAFVLFFVIKPIFLNLPNPASSGHEMFSLKIQGTQVVYIVLFAVSVGVIAGLLPALFLSKLKSTAIFKDASKIKLFSGLSFRRVLSVLQFTLSIGLIMSAVLVNKQYQFAVNYDIGFDTENIVNVKIKGDYLELLAAEYAKIPEVVETSRSMMTMGTGGAELARAKSDGMTDPIMLFWSSIDENYLQMHNFELLAGTDFVPQSESNQDNKNVIINEHLLKSLELEGPEKAIGEIFEMQGYMRGQLQVIGVVKDFVSTSINTKGGNAIMSNQNFAFVQAKPRHTKGLLGVKFQGTDLVGLMQKLEASYSELDPVHPFEAEFYDDQIMATYQSQKTVFTLVSFLAFLAVSISMLGLLGMAVFTTESRIKEISIRKVLGANIGNLMVLLSRGFVIMIVVAGAIAIPVGYFVVDKYVLNSFNYRAETGVIELVSGFIAVLLIGALTITWQIKQAAMQNPADLLRSE